MKGFSSKAIHGMVLKKDVHGALRFPVYDNAAFEVGTSRDLELAFEGKKAAHVYSRITNPTVEDFEQKVVLDVSADGGDAALVAEVALRRLGGAESDQFGVLLDAVEDQRVECDNGHARERVAEEATKFGGVPNLEQLGRDHHSQPRPEAPPVRRRPPSAWPVRRRRLPQDRYRP